MLWDTCAAFCAAACCINRESFILFDFEINEVLRPSPVCVRKCISDPTLQCHGWFCKETHKTSQVTLLPLGYRPALQHMHSFLSMQAYIIRPGRLANGEEMIFTSWDNRIPIPFELPAVNCTSAFLWSQPSEAVPHVLWMRAKARGGRGHVEGVITAV